MATTSANNGSNDPDNSAEIPDELKHLIDSSVEEKKVVSASDLVSFFEKTIEKLGDSSFFKETEDMIVTLKSDNRMRVAQATLEATYTDIWKELGFSADLGKEAVTKAPSFLNQEGVKLEIREQLRKLMIDLSQTEQDFVGKLLIGEKAYASRKKEQEKAVASRKKLEDTLETMPPEERGVFVQDLKEKGAALRKRLMEMPRDEAAKYVASPNEEDKELLEKLSGLALMVGEVQHAASHQHGHSHNGQACHGHGAAQSHDDAHGHSHGHGHSH